MHTEEHMELMPVIERAGKDVREAAARLGRDEARYLVDYYYQAQEYRKAAMNQKRSAEEQGEPNAAIAWLGEQHNAIETKIKSLLGVYAKNHEAGAWAMAQVGIGPVIAAGLLAHIDASKCPTAGGLFRYAGLDPTAQWGKGEKRPWNAALKVLCWKIGESFVKTCNNPKAFYGPIYAERKAYEDAKNANGDYAGQAAAKLERFKIGKETDAYKHYSDGRLPPAHIHQRAKRYATKLFLSHFHEVLVFTDLGHRPPAPYSINILGHAHYIAPPSFDFKGVDRAAVEHGLAKGSAA